MFESQQTSTGTQYTLTVALLLVAFLFSPIILVLSGAFSYVSISMALTGSALCAALAWLNWKKHSKLTIPSIVASRVK